MWPAPVPRSSVSSSLGSGCDPFRDDVLPSQSSSADETLSSVPPRLKKTHKIRQIQKSTVQASTQTDPLVSSSASIRKKATFQKPMEDSEEEQAAEETQPSRGDVQPPLSASDIPLRPCMATAGLVFAARSQLEVWTTKIASEEARNGPELSHISSPLMSFLGEEKYRRVSQMTAYSRTVSAGERCFFVLLLLVTVIYAVGIVTALLLLSFHMWFFD